MASTEIDFQPAKPKKKGLAGKWDGFKTFCYNPQNGTFCGRTGKSWGKIGLFYLVYYALLAAFCAMMMAIFFTTIDDREPKQQGMDSLIKGNPGMAFVPMPNVETTLIKFKSGEEGDDTSFKKYVKALTDFLKPYEEDLKDQVTDCNVTHRADPDLPCRFNMADLGTWCTSGNKFGYYEGQPCIIIKMNKVWGWEPDVFNDTDSDLPTNMFHSVEFNNSIPVTCQPLKTRDQPNFGSVTIYPPWGFPAPFFPYLGQVDYEWPLVAARFSGMRNNTDIAIWCRAWARNLENDHWRDRNAGVYGWEPIEYNNSTRPPPARLANKIVPGYLPITCDGEQNADVDTIGEIQFYPPGGIPTIFFPYKNRKGYRSPIVMARFKNPMAGNVIQVWCKVWAHNIYHHKNDKAGSFRFELLVN